MKTEVVIYDDHCLFVESMRNFISLHGLKTKFPVHQAYDEETLKELTVQQNTMLIMSADRFGSIEIFSVLEKLKLLNSALKVIVISRSTDPKFIKKLFEHNIKGFLGKRSEGKDVANAVKEVSEGRVFINAAAKERLFNFICNVGGNKKKSILSDELTNREKEVLVLICEGFRTKEIADQMFISTHTVDSHRKNIMLKFNVHSTSQLVKFSLENNIVN